MFRSLFFAFVLAVSAACAQSPIVIGSVVNGASFKVQLSPGVAASIFGTGLSGTNLTVRVATIVCPLQFQSATQLNIHIPLNVPTGPTTLVVSHSGASSAPFPVTLGAYAPAFLATTSNGNGSIIAFSSLGALISAANPAHPGDTVSGLALGLGQTNPPSPPAGTAVPSTPIFFTLATPSVTVGGVQAPVSFSGLTQFSGFLDYVYQVDFQVPNDASQPSQPVVLGIGNFSSVDEQVSLPIGVICSFIAGAGTSNLSAQAGSGSFDLNANDPTCIWKVQSQAPWLSVTSTASGKGSATANFSFTANPGSAPRNGSFTVTTGGRIAATVNVTQNGSGVSQTITTNPAGLQVSVDGQNAATPVNVLWVPGSAHTVATASPQTGSDGRLYAFQSWSDNGAISHTVFAPSASGTLTATFAQGQSTLNITSLNPPSMSAGAPGFTLTVNGNGFAAGAVVEWNGLPLSTMFVSPGTLTAFVPASLVAQAGSANITVVSGGATSNTVKLTIAPGVRLSISTGVTFQLPHTTAMPVLNSFESSTVAPRDTTTPTPITAGSNLTFQMQVANSAPVDATQVVVASNLTTGLVFQSCFTSTGGACSANGGAVTANLGTVPAYQTATVTIQASAASNIPTGTNLGANSQVTSAEQNNSNASSTAPPLTIADPNTQFFQVSRTTIPNGAGTVTSNPASVNDFYLVGTQILYSAVPKPGYVFSSFGGDLSGTVNPALLTVTRAGMVAQANFAPAGMQFVPATPCRIADTRLAKGPFGGPSVAGVAARDIAIPFSTCGVPSNATAYSLNVTVVPHGLLSFLTLWPAGQPRPLVSTLNSLDGRIKANAAMVPAGAGGSVSVYATDATDAVLDINGYFIPAAALGASLSFYPLAPCRVADTRLAPGPLGGPALAANQPRVLPVQSSACGVPATALAYSLNMTVVPAGPLGFLSAWPAGQTQPLVSTLNAPTGTIVANAAIVPAGSNGSIAVFATDKTDLVVDINGYFGPRGGAGALSFYPLGPCRVADTRLAAGAFGGPSLTGGQSRNFAIPSSACDVPAAASAYSFNATVVPTTALSFLTLWPAGGALPLVSTLNAPDGAITSNAAIVPAGTAGAISAFVTDGSNLVLDIGGYFAP